MTSFLDRIRATVLKPQICETRFPCSSAKARIVASMKKVNENGLFTSEFRGVLAGVKKSLRASIVSQRLARDEFNLVLGGVTDPCSLSLVLDKLEPFVAAARLGKIEGSFDPNNSTLTVEISTS